jgi:alpha-mannosidase
MLITEVASTDLFGGTAARPLQIIRVRLANDGGGMIRDPTAVISVRIQGAGVSTPEPTVLTGFAHGEQRTVDVGVQIAAPLTAGGRRRVTAIAESPNAHWRTSGQITIAEPGWTMWMVSHFHYDPVWWNTQGRYTQTWPLLPAEDGSLPDVRTVFELVRLHLAEARSDPDYKFVLAELDYLKPHFDAYPQDRAELRDLLAAGRVEIVGGSYNEPNTNLTCAESTIRNAMYGLTFQRDMLGADPSTAWMLDAFGFDPSYPGLMAAAGMAESSWARGPFHQWGPDRATGGNRRMQFPSEFEWLSPDGNGLLTSYMPNHYGAGWVMQHAVDLAAAEKDAYTQFRQLAPVAATRNVLLPVGGDHVVPSRWATAIHRDWNARYVWPRFVTAVPREFFAAVRADAAAAGAWIMPQTRDMNPVYTGKDVTYIDTKQAQRDAEIAVLDGERLATVAWLAGASYPVASLDKAWRLLVFGAHHDAITGTESDQVYLDLLAGWREAFDRGDHARREAARYLASLADTGTAADTARAGGTWSTRAVLVFNTLAWPRSGLAKITLGFAGPGTGSVLLTDETGTSRDYLAQGVTSHPDGSLASVTLTFRAQDVPAIGYRTYLATAVPVQPAPAGSARASQDLDQGLARRAGWLPAQGFTISNDALDVVADPDRGGVLSAITDRSTGTQLLAGAGNELVLQEEYPAHPRWAEGPWLLCPTGSARGSAAGPATLRAERCPIGSRLVAEFELDELRVTAETLLWDGSDLVEFRAHVDGSIGHDRLLRVRFGTDVPGGLPVFQTGLSVIGRPPGHAEQDVAEHHYTLDNPAHEWFGVGSTARVSMTSPDGARRQVAFGVAEVIAPAGPAGDRFAPRDASAGSGFRLAVRDLLVALARSGVTATCSVPEGPRYGSIELDSNLPDIRIVLGGPDQNAFTARLLASAGSGMAASLDAQLAATGSARVWVPAARARRHVFSAGADLRAIDALPVLIVAGSDLGASIAALIADLSDADIDVPWPAGGAGAEPDLAGYSVALLNRGLPGSLVTPTGEAHISLMRACSTWPCGIWLDGEKRTVPDGSSFAWQHWSHTFEYALASGPRDWREAGFPQAGQEYCHQLLTCDTDLHDGPLPPTASLASAGPAGVDLMALKPRGNPLAPLAQPDPHDGVTARLRDLGEQPGPAAATVRLFTGIAAASVTGLLELDAGPPADCAAGSVTVAVPQAGTVTLNLQPGDWSAGPGPAAQREETGAALESAQPVFTRYWLHGKGPAPAGNLPVAVHLSPDLLALAPGESGTLRLTVGCGPEPVSGTVTLEVPDGVELEPAAPLDYQLVARGFTAWELAVTVRPDAAPVRHFVAARITGPAGQLAEDVVAVAVGEVRPPAPELLPLDQLTALLDTVNEADAAEAVLTRLSSDLELRPGDCGTVVAALSNNTASQLRGEAQLISPVGSWAAVAPCGTSFCAEPGGTATMAFSVAVPADARPGQRWWALIKVMYFGRLRYSEPVWVSVIG